MDARNECEIKDLYRVLPTLPSAIRDGSSIESGPYDVGARLSSGSTAQSKKTIFHHDYRLVWNTLNMIFNSISNNPDIE